MPLAALESCEHNVSADGICSALCLPQVAAAWINAAKQQRQGRTAVLLSHLQLSKLSLPEMRLLDSQPEVLELPGLGVALFRVLLQKQPQ
jgi:hypothetical protein